MLILLTSTIVNLLLLLCGMRMLNSAIVQELMSSNFGATNVFDYTNEVQRIRSKVDNSLNLTLNDCCGYRYQLLDQFCASRPYVSNGMMLPEMYHIYIYYNITYNICTARTL